jgi:sugar transferase EpsL
MKRSFDLIVAGLMLIALGPILLLVALLIKMLLGGPILFRQERPGRYGKTFTIFKFRTMRDAVDRNGISLADEFRMTELGSFLRSTSLDELPELWNVLKGEMSLVGPRPLLKEYLPLYTAEQACRHEVRPGITGWAQVSGRNAISWDEKFNLDVWYVNHRSFLLDLKILFLTLWKVLRRDGIAQSGHVAAERFRGGGQ